MLFDTHTHVTFSGFDADREDIMQKCQEKGIWMTNVGTDYETSKLALELAKKYAKGVYATIGLHPTDSPTDEFDDKQFSGLIDQKVVAVGECGLDYYHLPENREHGIRRQKAEFIKQIHFAQKHSLPLVVHCRDAYADTLEILKSEYSGTGIIHSFTDSWETAKKFLELGFYIAFNGILYFDKTGRLDEVVQKMPTDKILTETDAPFLTPPPDRGKRNDPGNVRLVAEKIAMIRREEISKVSEYTFNNALMIYNINVQP